MLDMDLTDGERKQLVQAKNHLSLEDGISRLIALNFEVLVKPTHALAVHILKEIIFHFRRY